MISTNLQRDIRRQRSLAVVGLISAFMLVSVASRNQRALFPTGPFALAASALTAVPTNPVVTALGGGGVGGRGPRFYVPSGQGGGLGGPAAPGGAGAPGGIAPVGPAAPTQLASSDALPNALFPGGGTAGGDAPPAPGVPGDFGNPVGGVPGVPSSGSVIVPAVPEPATWLVMIAGISMVGGALRSRRARQAETRRIV